MNRLRYFDGVRTLRDAKARYRLLAKRLHPDAKDGNGEWFREMVAEYEEVRNALSRRQSAISITTTGPKHHRM